MKKQETNIVNFLTKKKTKQKNLEEIDIEICQKNT